MIIGIGCDIIDIRRIRKIILKYGDKFLRKIFTDEEIKKCDKNDCSSYYAKRFSAKESYSKATKLGIGEKVNFRDIEIMNDEKGAPFFSKHTFKAEGVNAFLALSDEHDYAISYVVLEKYSRE